MPEPRIRRALPADRDALVATVAAAFREDPAWRFLLAGEYERLAPRFVATLLELRLGRGSVWVSDDLATVAMWEPPRGESDSSVDREALWDRFRRDAGEEAWTRLAAYNQALDALAPAEPFWYLGVLATHPARRREGLASAVLAPALERADRDGLACCLETSTDANRRFYEARGFVESRRVPLAGGPPTWWLRRAAPEPRPR